MGYSVIEANQAMQGKGSNFIQELLDTLFELFYHLREIHIVFIFSLATPTQFQSCSYLVSMVATTCGGFDI